MPESFNAFCNIVSLTAANTSLMFDVSVACVKLGRISAHDEKSGSIQDSLRIQVEVCSVDLIESPE